MCVTSYSDGNRDAIEIKYAEDKSFHSDVYLNGSNKVYEEYITLKNTSNNDHKFTLSAEYISDFNSGYNFERELYGYCFKNKEDRVFSIKSEEERRYLVYFITDNWNEIKKTDRKPPEKINIYIIE